jgi:hypothetical protein
MNNMPLASTAWLYVAMAFGAFSVLMILFILVGMFEILGSKYWMLDAGCWMLDAGCWMLDRNSQSYRFVDS